MNRILLSAENLTLGYEPASPILGGVSFEVRALDFIGISGPNGGGKTTLIRTLLGLLTPLSGRILYPGGTRPSTGYMPQQNRIDRKFPISVSETVESGLAGTDFKDSKERIFRTLEAVGMTDYASTAIGALSGGQLQRVLLARAFVSSPDLLILDEPDSYVDRAFGEKLYELLPMLNQESAILLVSHDERALRELPRRHFLVDRSFRES